MLGACTGIGGGALGLGVGAGTGTALAGASTGLLPVLAVAVPAVVGAYLGFGLGLLAFRRLQGWGFGKGETALRQLARFLQTEVNRSLGSGG